MAHSAAKRGGEMVMELLLKGRAEGSKPVVRAPHVLGMESKNRLQGKGTSHGQKWPLGSEISTETPNPLLQRSRNWWLWSPLAQTSGFFSTDTRWKF